MSRSLRGPPPVDPWHRESRGSAMKAMTAALFCLLATTAAGSVRLQEGRTLSLNFGVYQSDKATAMYRQFTPVLDHLASDMERRLGCPVDIKLTIFPSYEEGIDSLVRGSVDFVRFGPASYITAKARQPGIDLLAMETEFGEKRFKGVIIVQKESSIRSLADLRGKRFAFGDPSSTIGRYLVQAELLKAGLHASDLPGSKYLNRHDTVVKAVEIGDFAAGAVMDKAFERGNTKGTLRVLASFENVTKPWVSRQGLDVKAFEAIQQSLYALKDPDTLKE